MGCATICCSIKTLNSFPNGNTMKEPSGFFPRKEKEKKEYSLAWALVGAELVLLGLSTGEEHGAYFVVREAKDLALALFGAE